MTRIGEPQDPVIGRRVMGSYVVRRVLGEGGMGRVYVAQHARLENSYYAVKVLLPQWSQNPHIVERFTREAMLASKLAHSHIARVVDAGRFDDGLHYLVMEFLDGVTLEHRLCQWGCENDFEDALSILLQVCSGLAVAHAAGVVHRDLKPENIFLIRTADNPLFVKILDFGIAKLGADLGTAITGTGAVVGTPSYMAPEQILNSKQVDHRADIYALGVIAYRMLAGRLPFAAASLGELALAQQHLPPPPASLRTDTPMVWSDLVLRCLSRHPDSRPQTVRQVARPLILGHPNGTAVAARVAADLQATADHYDETVKNADEPPMLTPSRSTTSYHTAGAVTAAPSRRRRPGPYIAAFLGMAVVGGVGAAFVSHTMRSDGQVESSTWPTSVDAITHDAGTADFANPANPDLVPTLDTAPSEPPPPDAAALVTLEIATEPSGAALTINGTSHGTAPVQWTGLPGTALTIEARLPGHDESQREIVVDGSETRLELSLDRTVNRPRRQRPRSRPAVDEAPDPDPPSFDPNGVIR